MAREINPRNLRPADLLRLVNTAGPDRSLSEAQLRRHRNRAGYRLGDARTIDLFRYAAWLTVEYFKPKSEPLTYEQRKAREAQRPLAKLRDPFTGRMLSSIEHRKPDLRAGDYWTDNIVGTGDDRHNRSTLVLSNARPARILSI